MQFVKLPSGTYVNLARMVEVYDNPDDAERRGRRRVVSVVVDGLGNGRAYFDGDADFLLAAVDEAMRGWSDG